MSIVKWLLNRPPKFVVASQRSRLIKQLCVAAGQNSRNSFVAAPASTWPEAAEKARYLIGLLAQTSIARDPRRQKLIAGVLDDFVRLSGEPAARQPNKGQSEIASEAER